MEDDEDEDKLVSEHPLYLSDFRAMFGGNDETRLLQAVYPLRPENRPYNTAAMQHVRYKPQHKVLEITCGAYVPESNNGNQDPSKSNIKLAGTGHTPDVPLCAMVRVKKSEDGSVPDSFVLMPVDELVYMRPNMEAFVAEQRKRDAAAAAESEDKEWLPKTEKGVAEKAKTAAAGKGKSSANMKAINVEMQRRETERQTALRMRSYTHHREQIDKEEWRVLEAHDVAQGGPMLRNSCEKMIQKVPTEQPMAMSRDEYIRVISPMTWLGHDRADLVPVAGAAKDEPPPKLDVEALAAVKAALEGLFQEHHVVSLADVRQWLGSFSAAPKAALAAAQPDDTLVKLLIGGGSIRLLHDRFVLEPSGDDLLRHLLLRLLEACPGGIKRADVMAEAKEAGLDVSEHQYSKVLKELCLAKGATWYLKQGASL